MEGFLEFDLSDFSPQVAGAIVAVTMSVGTLYCFLGYRTLKFIIGLTGFILAGGAAAALVGWLTNGNYVALGIAAVLGGIAGALAFFFLYRVGIFVLGFLGAALIAHNVLSTVDEAWVPLAIIGIGLAGGGVAIFLEAPVMMIATALIGAWIVVSGVGYFLIGSEVFETPDGDLDETRARMVLVGSWLVLSIAGVFAQFATRKRDKD